MIQIGHSTPDSQRQFPLHLDFLLSSSKMWTPLCKSFILCVCLTATLLSAQVVVQEGMTSDSHCGSVSNKEHTTTTNLIAIR